MPKKSQNLTSNLATTFQKDKELFEKTATPIITVSASFKEDLKGLHDLPETDNSTDVVFSRAHYSMALGVAAAAWAKGKDKKINPKEAWLIDVTNYVNQDEWKSIEMTDLIGKTIARWPILKTLKDLVDKFARSKMPILENVTPPTQALTADVHKTILSMHIVTGNILAQAGKNVVEVITDPHVREDYLTNAEKENIRFCVFDEATKEEFFKVAKRIGKKIPKEQIENKVIVTGPPVDPRIIDQNKKKKVWTSKRPLRICLTTGGLGTNKVEIKEVLEKLLPEIKKQTGKKKNENLPSLELCFYAGTHKDHKDMAIKIAKKNNLAYRLISPNDPANFEIKGDLNKNTKAETQFLKNRTPHIKFNIIYHPQIVDANELLIHYGFPWADLFITKPSGDMAYDAALSGAALLTMKEWGEWEHNVRKVFEKQNISQKLDLDNLVTQLERITFEETATVSSKKPKSAQRPIPQLKEKTSGISWIATAMENTKKMDKIFYEGAKNILKAVKA